MRFSPFASGFTREFQNPLSAIFLDHDIQCLELLAFFTLFSIGIAQYFMSDGKRRTVLLFYLVSSFMRSIAFQTGSIFLLARNPQDIVEYPLQVSLNLLLSALFFGVLYILLTGLQSFSPAKTPNIAVAQQNFVPMKWSRSTHQLVDYFMIFGVSSLVYKAIQHSGTGLFDANRLWEYITDFVAFVISYFLAEATLGTTAAKILTGTEVVKAEDGTTPTKLQILGRTFARIIPFEPFSVFAKQLWHDRLSNTVPVYTGAENWLARQSKITFTIFAGLLVIGIWNIVCAVLLFTDHHFRYYQSAIELPVALLVITVPYTAILFTCWIASIANYSYNLGHREVSSSNQYFFGSLLCWVPILNFSALYSIQAEAYDDLSRLTGHTPAMDTLSRRATQLSRAFSFMYVLLAIGIFYMFADNWKTRMAFPAFSIGIGIVIWSIYAMLHARAIRNVFNTLPETSVTTTPTPGKDEVGG